MSKLDNEFKNEFDKNFREGSYIIRKFLIAILIIVLVLEFLELDILLP